MWGAEHSPRGIDQVAGRLGTISGRMRQLSWVQRLLYRALGPVLIHPLIILPYEIVLLVLVIHSVHFFYCDPSSSGKRNSYPPFRR